MDAAWAGGRLRCVGELRGNPNDLVELILVTERVCLTSFGTVPGAVASNCRMASATEKPTFNQLIERANVIVSGSSPMRMRFIPSLSKAAVAPKKAAVTNTPRRLCRSRLAVAVSLTGSRRRSPEK